MDSYGFFLITGFDEQDRLKTDLEKDGLLNDVREKCKIEKWSFRESYSNSIKGTGTIYNGGKIPVEFVKVEITYSNEAGQTVNTDDFYAVSDKLYPGQRRIFDWYTSNCYDCDRATIRLVFDRN